MAETLTRLPQRIVGGSTVRWTFANTSDYPAPTWTAFVDFVAAGDHQQVAASDAGDGTHLFEIDPATSDNFTPGPYSWQQWVTDGTDVCVVDEGTTLFVADFADQTTGYDARSFARQALEAIEARIVGKASKDQLAFSIAGRSVSRYAWEELLDARDRFRKEVAREVRAERARRGLPAGGIVKTRFV